MSHVRMSHVTHMNESCHANDASNHTHEYLMKKDRFIMSRIWMSHVTYMNESCPKHEWVMSHMWMVRFMHMMRQITHTNTSWRKTYSSFQAYEWVKSQVWMSHVADMNESCHKYGWVMSHTQMHHRERQIDHGTQTNETFRTYETSFMGHVTHTRKWVMLHISMKHVSRTNESCHAYESPIRTRHVKNIREPHHKYEWIMSQI